jgi:hypothetical protein
MVQCLVMRRLVVSTRRVRRVRGAMNGKFVTKHHHPVIQEGLHNVAFRAAQAVIPTLAPSSSYGQNKNLVVAVASVRGTACFVDLNGSVVKSIRGVHYI